MVSNQSEKANINIYISGMSVLFLLQQKERLKSSKEFKIETLCIYFFLSVCDESGSMQLVAREHLDEYNQRYHVFCSDIVMQHGEIQFFNFDSVSICDYQEVVQ